jgi:hypothetical protein
MALSRHPQPEFIAKFVPSIIKKDKKSFFNIFIVILECFHFCQKVFCCYDFFAFLNDFKQNSLTQFLKMVSTSLVFFYIFNLFA